MKLKKNILFLSVGCVFLLLLVNCVSTGKSVIQKEVQLEIKAHIDGQSFLYIQKNQLWWVHQQWEVPKDMTINGKTWKIDWKEKDLSIRPNTSSIFDLSKIGINIPGSYLIVDFKINKARHNVKIATAPSINNEYLSIINFDDGPVGGEDEYDITVKLSSLPDSTEIDKLLIFKAEYGANNTWLDVTDILNKRIIDNTLSVQASNAEFGDPLPGAVKYLRVIYFYKGMGEVEEFQEGEELNIPRKLLSEVEQIVNKINEMPWTGADKEIINVTKEARRLSITNPSIWFKLGMINFDNGYYKESLDAFITCSQLSEDGSILMFASTVWQGHMLDLQGEREAAIEQYNKALAKADGFSMRHDQYGIIIDKNYVEQRLLKPFQLPEQGSIVNVITASAKKDFLPDIDISKNNNKTDNFDGKILDDINYVYKINNQAVVEQNKGLIIKTNKDSATSSSDIITKFKLSGDFVAQIEFTITFDSKNFKGDHIDGAVFGIFAADFYAGIREIFRAEGGGYAYVCVWGERQNRFDWQQLSDSPVSNAWSGIFRIERKGDNICFKYDLGSGWEILSVLELSNAPVSLQISSASINAWYTCTTKFNNLLIKCDNIIME